MKKFTSWIGLLSFLAISTTIFADTKSLSPFDEIILSGNVSALLIAGEEESIDIKNDADRLDFYVEGKSLKVKATDLVKYNKTPTIKVIITYKKLRGIRARAGASAYTEQAIKGDQLALKFSSGASGELEVAQSSIDITVSEGSAEVMTTKSIDARASTGGNITYKGDPKKVQRKDGLSGTIRSW